MYECEVELCVENVQMKKKKRIVFSKFETIF